VSVNAYLEPGGFATDIRSRPTTDLSRQLFIPAEPPRIAAATDWHPLGDAGWYRYDPSGHVFHYTRGANGTGFAVCLYCGRADSDQDGVHPLPADHNRLRGGRREEGQARCPGNDSEFAMQRHLWLGGGRQTDVFELILRDPSSEKLDLGDVGTSSAAVALRIALAKELGVDMREIGWATKRVRGGEGADVGGPYRSLLLYDTAAGGAGYAREAGEKLLQLLKEAAQLLNCPRGCDAACHGCLLTFDVDQQAPVLDRHAGLEVLSDGMLKAAKALR